MTIKKNQIYKAIGHDYHVIICGKKGSNWKAKILTDKPGVYRGSHTLNPNTIRYKYELIA